MEVAVRNKIQHMKEKGLLHDIEDQIMIERDMVKAKLQRSRVDSTEKPMAARIEDKDERIKQLEVQYHKASELLQQSENEIIRLTKENAEKSEEIQDLESELCILVPARRELRQSTTRAAVNRALAESFYNKACQTPDVWEWDHKMTSAERKEQEMKDMEEMKVMLANDLLSKKKSAAKQSTSEGADPERRRRSTARVEARMMHLTQNILTTDGPGGKRTSGRAKVLSVDEVGQVSEAFAHPLKNLGNFKKSLGCDMILSLAGVPNVTVPAMSMSSAEEICLMCWREKLEVDEQAVLNGDKLPPLPEVALEYLVKQYQYRSVAMKMFRSFLWACSEYRKKSLQLKFMWSLLNLDRDKKGSIHSSGKGGLAVGSMSPGSAIRSLVEHAGGSEGKRSGGRYTKLLKGKKKIGFTGEEIQEDIAVYDAAKVQFFFNFLRRFFFEPVDMYDCLTMKEDTGHILLR